jgi:hypothetical protein
VVLQVPAHPGGIGHRVDAQGTQPGRRADAGQHQQLRRAGPQWLTGAALDWYESLRVSPEAVSYTPGDWTTAVVIARCGMALCARPSAVMLASFLTGCDRMLATLGSRQRAGISLAAGDRPDPDQEHAAARTAAYRARLRGDSETPART